MNVGLLLWGPGLLAIAASALLLARRPPAFSWPQVALIAALLAISAPAVTLAHYGIIGRLAGPFYPGEWADGDIYHSMRVVAIGVLVWMLPLFGLAAAAFYRARPRLSAGGWMAWLAVAFVGPMGLYLAYAQVFSVQDPLGFALAHRVSSCGLSDGTRVFVQDLRSGRDVSLDALSGWHGIALLGAKERRELQEPSATPPPATVAPTSPPSEAYTIRSARDARRPSMVEAPGEDHDYVPMPLRANARPGEP